MTDEFQELQPGEHAVGRISDEKLKGLMDDNPRNSDEERRRKTQLAPAIRRDEIDPALYGYTYDLSRPVPDRV